MPRVDQFESLVVEDAELPIAAHLFHCWQMNAFLAVKTGRPCSCELLRRRFRAAAFAAAGRFRSLATINLSLLFIMSAVGNADTVGNADAAVAPPARGVGFTNVDSYCLCCHVSFGPQ